MSYLPTFEEEARAEQRASNLADLATIPWDSDAEIFGVDPYAGDRWSE